MCKIKFSLDRRGNGDYNPVILRVNESGQQIKRSTKVKLKGSAWDVSSSFPKDKFSFEFEYLAKLERDILNRVNSGNTNIKDVLSLVMDTPDSENKEDRLVNLIASFVEDKKQFYSQSAITHYEKLSELVKGYCIKAETKCFISNIDKNWISKFVDYMCYEIKYSNSTVEVMLKKLVSVLNYHDKTVKFKIADSMRGLKKAKSVNGPKPYLSLEQISKIYEFVYEKYGLDSIEYNVFRIFMFGSETGARFNELMKLTPKMVENGVLTYSTSKNTSRISVPLSGFCMIFVDHRNEKLLPQISNKVCNTVLTKILTEYGLTKSKIVVRFNGKNREEESKTLAELITMHSSRRSYCSNLIDNGMTFQEVADLTGISVLTLITYYSSSNKEERNKKVLSILNR